MSGQRHAPKPWADPARVRSSDELCALFPHCIGSVFRFKSLVIVVFEDCSIHCAIVDKPTAVLL